jgi:hypothetical protein
MNNPAGPRKMNVNEFVTEQLEKLASHSTQDQRVLNEFIGKFRNMPSNQYVLVYDIEDMPSGNESPGG